MPATEAYLLLGLAAIAGIPLLFIASMVWRRRDLERDHAMLDRLEHSEEREMRGEREA